MRSIFLLVKTKDKQKVVDYLNTSCKASSDESQWVSYVNDDPIFYIYPIEIDTPFDRILHNHDSTPPGELKNVYAAWQVDVSGRHKGDNEVRELVNGALTADGFAMDDYSYHLWTLQEINANIIFDECRFFGYDDHYERMKRNPNKKYDWME